MNSIGTKIQALRKNKKMTQSDLANALSVSAQSVSKWENNISVPDISLLPIIARFFGITMDELFGYKADILNYRERFIQFMVDNNVLQFGEFKLHSERCSPYYINTSNLKSASQISKLGEFYAECFLERNIKSNFLISYSEKESPILISTAMTLFSKYGIDIQYGTNSFGAIPTPTDRATLITDTLTSGASLRIFLNNSLKSSNVNISDVIIFVDRMEVFENSNTNAIKEIERELNVRIHAIVTLDDIINSLERQIIKGYEFIEPLKKYKQEYGGKQ